MIFEDLIIDGTFNPSSATGQVQVYTSGGASYNQFIHLEVRHNGGSGLGFSQNNGNSNYNQVLYCSFHDNGTDTSLNNAGYGIYSSSDYNLFEGNDFYSNHGYGMQMRGSNNIVRNNRFYNNVINGNGGGVGGYSGGGFNMLGDAAGTGNNNQVYNNLAYNNGFSLARGLAPSGSFASGLLVYSYESNSAVYNNTVYGNFGVGIMAQYYDGTAPPIIENNIVYDNLGGNIVDYGAYQAAATVVVLINNLTE